MIYTLHINKEHKQEAQCAQRGVDASFVICGFIKNFWSILNLLQE